MLVEDFMHLEVDVLYTHVLVLILESKVASSHEFLSAYASQSFKHKYRLEETSLTKNSSPSMILSLEVWMGISVNLEVVWLRSVVVPLLLYDAGINPYRAGDKFGATVVKDTLEWE